MKMYRFRAAALFLAVGLVAAVSGASAQIVIGQSADLSGPAAVGVKETIMGSQLVIDHVNAQGGVHGQQIEVIRLDDSLDPKRSLENTRILIEDKKVLALLLNRGTPNTIAVIPLLDKYGVALVGPSTGATPCWSSRGMTARVLGVPRLSSSASTFLSSMRMRVFSSERLGSRLSSSRITSICWP